MSLWFLVCTKSWQNFKQWWYTTSVYSVASHTQKIKSQSDFQMLLVSALIEQQEPQVIQVACLGSSPTKFPFGLRLHNVKLLSKKIPHLSIQAH